jgi:uncharacterized protein (UPF0332 family)
MSFNCGTYVDLAGELIDCSKNLSIEEAYFRSSVSRSYYGVFLGARTLMEGRKQHIPKSGEAHKIVREYYITSKNRVERKIGNTLKNLIFERHHADYETKDTFDKARAVDAHEKAVRAKNRLIDRGAVFK